MMDTVWPLLQSLQGGPAYLLLFGLLFGCGVGLPMNEDIVLLAASALTLQGVMDPLPLIGIAWLGLVGGDALVFYWGYRYGAGLLQKPFMARVVRPERLLALQQTMQRYGPGYIFVVRFMPGIRTALFLAAGSLRMRYRDLFVFDGLAALVELPLLVYGVRYVGGRWQQVLEMLHHLQVYLVLLAALAVAIWWWWRRRKKAGGPR
ncbi:MAG: DedA family protein [Proteobacteria bacterium]|nr:DedA family protein [Pseudomonadota bacterium]